VILGYYEDGPNLVSMAMNGWEPAEPAWWLNLQAEQHATVELPGGTRREVVGRAALGVERERLWERWRELDEKLDRYAARRPQADCSSGPRAEAAGRRGGTRLTTRRRYPTGRRSPDLSNRVP
jgi:hypothetical protein